jgi:hypothetical protein
LVGSITGRSPGFSLLVDAAVLGDSQRMACEIVDRLKVRSCLIDGEAVACDENGLAVFERLRRKPRVSMSSSTPSTSSSWMAKTCGASR